MVGDREFHVHEASLDAGRCPDVYLAPAMLGAFLQEHESVVGGQFGRLTAGRLDAQVPARPSGENAPVAVTTEAFHKLTSDLGVRTVAVAGASWLSGRNVTANARAPTHTPVTLGYATRAVITRKLLDVGLVGEEDCGTSEPREGKWRLL